MSSRQIQFVRGNTQCINHYVGPIGSFAINLDDWTIHIQDGTTPGGHIVSGFGNVQQLVHGIETLKLDYTTNYPPFHRDGSVELSGNIRTIKFNPWNFAGYSGSMIQDGADYGLGLFAGSNNFVTISTTTNNYDYSVTKRKDWQFDWHGNLTTPGSIIPNVDNQHSLGSSTNQWRDLWVSNNTIYINRIPLSIDTGNNLVVNGNVVGGGTNYGNANVAAFLPVYGGNFLASSVSTNSLALAGPTGHIGTVAVLDPGQGIYSPSFYNIVGGSGTGAYTVVSDAYDPRFTFGDPAWGDGYRVGDLLTVVNPVESYPGSPQANAKLIVTSIIQTAASTPAITVGNVDYKFSSTGNIILPPGGDILNSSNVSVLINTGNVKFSNNIIYDTQGVVVQTNSIPNGAGASFTLPPITGGDISTINNQGNVWIYTDLYDNHGWNFDVSGNLNLPSLGHLGQVWGDPGETTLVAPSGSYAALANHSGDQYVDADDNAVQIGTNYRNNGGNIWYFNKDGSLTMPGSQAVIRAAGHIFYLTDADGYLHLKSEGGISLDSTINSALLWTKVVQDPTAGILNKSQLRNDDSGVTIDLYLGDGNIATGNLREWRLDAEGITFPDATIQYTAATYSNVNVHNYLAGSGTQIFGGNVVIEGNLYVSNIVSVNPVTITASAPLLYLEANLSYPYNYDIGFYGQFTNTSYQHTGLVRDYTTNQWRLFSNVVAEPTTVVNFTNAVYDDLVLGNALPQAIYTNNYFYANGHPLLPTGVLAFTNDAGYITSANLAGLTNYSNVNVAAYLTTNNYLTSADVNLSIYAWNANLATYAWNSNVAAANVGMKGYVDSISSAWQANAYQQQALIGNLQASAYSNINVASYLAGLSYTNYSNVNVAAYLTTNNYLTTTTANLSLYAWNSNLALYAWNANLSTYATVASLNNYALNSNLSAYALNTSLSTYAWNANITNYSNVNVAAYLTTNNYLTSTTANLSLYAWNANIPAPYGNANVASYLAGLSYTNYSNVNVAAYLTTNNYLTSTTANLSLYAWNSNLATYAWNSNVSAANVGMKGYVDAQIASIGSNYGNANVAAYLPTYTGNVNAAYYTGNGALLTGLTLTYSLGDVNIVNPHNLDVLGYNSATGKWEAISQTGGNANAGGISLTSLSVGYTAPSGNGNLSYNNVSGIFTYTPADLSTYATTSSLNNYALNANLSSYALNSNLSTYAWNANVTNYSNVNVAAYLSTNSYLTATSANLTNYAWNANLSTYAWNANIPAPFGNTNVAAYLATNNYLTITSANLSNYAYNANVSSANIGMQGYVDAVTTAWTANAYQQQALIGNLIASGYSNVNLAAYLTTNSYLTATSANLSLYAWNANLATYAWNANVTAANVGMLGYVNQANTIQSAQISNLSNNMYTNANVQAYSLIWASSFIPSANVTYNIGNTTNYWNGAYANTINSLGNITAGSDLVAQANVWALGGAFRTAASTVFVANTTPTTAWAFGNASTINMGTATSTTTLGGGTGNIVAQVNGFAIGYRDIPQITLSSNVSITTSDAGKHYYSTVSANPQTLTIANNASQAFSIGATINVINGGTANIILTQGSGVTLYLAGNATTGNRTLTSYGMATITKVATNTWYCVGVGLS